MMGREKDRNKQDMRRRAGGHSLLLFITVVMLAALSSSCHAEKYVYVEVQASLVDPESPIIEVPKIKPIEDHYYYESWVYGSIEELPLTLRAYDSKGNELYSSPVYSGGMTLPFSRGISSIKITGESGGSRTEYYSREVDFCNNNGKCEYCENSDCMIEDGTVNCNDCTMFENSAVCGDCPSGEEDDYCDLARDSKCDPDCDGMDADCQDCEEEGCFYNDQGPPECELNYGGELCSVTEECDGEIVSTFEHGEYADSCCLGECIEIGTGEDSRECRIKGGEQCYSEEACGGSVQQMGDILCCIGRCIDLSAEAEEREPRYSNYGDDIASSDDLWELEGEGAGKEKESWIDGRPDVNASCRISGGELCRPWQECEGEILSRGTEGNACCDGECVEDKQEFAGSYQEELEDEYEDYEGYGGPGEGFLYTTEDDGPSLLWSGLAILIIILATGFIAIIVSRRREKGLLNPRLEYEYNYYKRLGYKDSQIIEWLAQRGWKQKDIQKLMEKKTGNER
ncbi:MAG: hypothetical protein R6U32_06170 [Candidatus Woesearchaeota archaeon]